jgi:hypothetical protein
VGLVERDSTIFFYCIPAGHHMSWTMCRWSPSCEQDRRCVFRSWATTHAGFAETYYRCKDAKQHSKDRIGILSAIARCGVRSRRVAIVLLDWQRPRRRYGLYTQIDANHSVWCWPAEVDDADADVADAAESLWEKTMASSTRTKTTTTLSQQRWKIATRGIVSGEVFFRESCRNGKKVSTVVCLSERYWTLSSSAMACGRFRIIEKMGRRSTKVVHEREDGQERKWCFNHCRAYCAARSDWI